MREKRISAILLLFFLNFARCQDIEKYSLLMPNVRPTTPDLYVCTPVKLDTENTYYIVGFEPNATMNTAHHIIIYGCSKPGADVLAWDCGEMSNSGDTNMLIAGPCDGDPEIIYAWARDAPNLILPKGVGFKVGKESRIKYLVLQVHYSHIDHFKDGSTDDSGIVLHYTKKPLTKLAGVYVLGTGGRIPPHSIEYMESSCILKENKVLHPFAYRTHTHALGKIVSGYVIKNDTWIELGKRDPLTPQMFYPTFYNGTIQKGDRLAARCTMQSTRDTWTYIGNTNENEMCNFYFMYYVDNDEPLKDGWCFTSGPPYYTWQSSGLVNIPDIEASTL